jgi:hypothetical protein
LTSHADWTAAIARASGAGDHLRAIDLASRALREFPDDLSLEYRWRSRAPARRIARRRSSMR